MSDGTTLLVLRDLTLDLCESNLMPAPARITARDHFGTSTLTSCQRAQALVWPRRLDTSLVRADH